MTILIKNGEVIGPDGPVKQDILIEDDHVSAVGRDLSAPDAEIVDAAGKLVFPGFIDTHTHLDMNTATMHTADDFHSGSAAAVCGGTTTVLDFATQEHGESLMQALQNWRVLADGKSCCDYGFHMAITEWTPRVADELTRMKQEGVTSYKLYMAYDNLRVADDIIYEVLKAVKAVGGIVGMHCENGDLVKVLTRELLGRGVTGPEGHPLSRPDVVEAEAIFRYLCIAELADAPVNIVHLSTARGMEIVENARSRGQEVYVETCPQYLLLTDENYGKPDFEGARYVLSPPLRKEADKEALWQAIEHDEIETIGSDHCSFFLRQKEFGRNNFSQIPNGAPGVDLRPALIYTYGVDAGRISLAHMYRLLCENPARLFGMFPRKGTLREGSDADIVIWDPDWQGTITDENQHTAADNTPYAGLRIQGRAARVYLRGREVVRDGEITKENQGRYVHRGACDFWLK
ncbi:MAG: dihydropyrimidinase [Clostridia bacterium]|nr:dihydropyrimidinase [Clostridia bacterium]